MSARSSTDTIPRPSGAVRIRSAISISGSPKNRSPPSASSLATSRSRTPAVALEMPPIAFSSAFPGPVRYASAARRSSRSTSGRPLSSQNVKTRKRLDSCVSFRPRTLARSVGPKAVTVARSGTPFAPVSDSSSTGAPAGSQSRASSVAR